MFHSGGDPERGRHALLTRAFNPPVWSLSAYDNVWKQWGLKEKPADFEKRFMERYGLHPAPYDNDGFPMGLRKAKGFFSVGLGNDCLICHGGSILGKSYIGLGNSSLDMQLLYDELAAADGRRRGTPFPFSNVRGTTEAGAMSVFLHQYRDEDLNLRAPVALGLRADLCEDPPAWWLLKKKKTMYYTGSNSARSVRAIMQFTLGGLAPPSAIKRLEPTFRDIQAFILTIEPPRYPFPVDQELATRGKALFRRHCSRCHGTYGEDASYPNKIVDLDVIGTDPTRALGISVAAREHYERSWFGQERGPDGRLLGVQNHRGYQAPPLDGVWATAPYFHNGSVPTVYHVLNSKARPRIFTRSYRTGGEDYDPVRLGWKIRPVDATTAERLPPRQRRLIYDTRLPGRGNGGHTFGDRLSESERLALIEYLKTL